MPPKKPKLPESVVAAFVQWIDAGAFAPSDAAAPRLDDPRKHWAFQPVRRVAPPAVKDAAWVETPIDAFILSALEARGWSPAPESSRNDWIRRVSFDLTSLPPSPGKSTRSRTTRHRGRMKRSPITLLA